MGQKILVASWAAQMHFICMYLTIQVANIEKTPNFVIFP